MLIGDHGLRPIIDPYGRIWQRSVGSADYDQYTLVHYRDRDPQVEPLLWLFIVPVAFPVGILAVRAVRVAIITVAVFTFSLVPILRFPVVAILALPAIAITVVTIPIVALAVRVLYSTILAFMAIPITIALAFVTIRVSFTR